MEYTRLGNSGLEVSKLCLGCMGFGDASKWSRGSWILNDEESIKIIKRALELGINFFDTADMYSLGESERILGKAIKKYANRNDVVIATKIFYPLREGKNNKGLSRKYIFEAVEASLKRLDMDYIDLLVIHRFDYDTPLEETMEAFNKNGENTLYWGFSYVCLAISKSKLHCRKTWMDKIYFNAKSLQLTLSRR